MTSAPAASRSGAALVMAGAALFGTIGTARVLGPDVSSVSVSAVRLALAALVLLALAMASGADQLIVAWRLPAVWVAGVAQAAFNVTFLAAVTRAGVAVGTLVAIGCTPILTGLLARQPVTRQWLGATLLALVGLVALLGDSVGRGVTGSGVAFSLGASASYATFILASSAVASASPGPTGVAEPVAVMPRLAGIFTIAAVCLCPALVLVSPEWAATGQGAAMVLYLSLVATVGAYSLFNRGLRAVPSGTAATLGLVEPLVAALLGVLVLDERLSPISWLGAGVVLVSLVLMVRVASARPGPELPVREVAKAREGDWNREH